MSEKTQPTAQELLLLAEDAQRNAGAPQPPVAGAVKENGNG